MEISLRQAVHEASLRVEVRNAAALVYAALQHEIDSRQPRCDASGRCCNFDAYGHRLYVTTIELAAFLAALNETAPTGPATAPRPGLSLPLLSPATQPAGCVFQVDGLCSVHSIRPFGCRIFFCDPTSDQWQHDQYERFHTQLKRHHEELAVPYHYVEWRLALATLTSDR